MTETDLYTFMGWLTCREQRLVLSASNDAAPAADVVAEYIKTFPDRLAAPPAPPEVEVVSALVHAAWMDSKRAMGVESRKAEDGEELMVPYEQLSEKAKQLDRGTVQAVYAAIAAAPKGTPA